MTVGYPPLILPHLLFVDLLVVFVPCAPARGPQRKIRFIDRREVLHAQLVTIVILRDRSILQSRFISCRVVGPFSQRRLDLTQRHDHELTVSAFTTSQRNRMRAGSLCDLSIWDRART